MVTCRRVLLLLFLLPALARGAQQPTGDRQPVVAGQFYPGNPEELKRTVEELFQKAVPRRGAAEVAALILPHAGYVYSGGVAASGFNQIDPSKKYDNIFLIGSSHHVGFEGASVYCSGDFITPLGTVTVNRKVGEELMKSERLFSDRPDVHVPEHSLEVLLPFLQVRMKQAFQIVPILMGTNKPETCQTIANALRPYWTGENLFIVSSDFSHYPPYEAAVTVDRATAEAIISNSPDALLRTLRQNEEAGIPGLATSLCGWSSVLTLMCLTSSEKGITYQAVQYKNSGDAMPGSKRGVVGYYAIMATRGESQPRSSFLLEAKERSTLLEIARRTLVAFVTDRSVPSVDASGFSGALRTPCGAFVTLTNHQRLRGCTGRFEAPDPLFRVVQQMAIASATQDSRFDPVVPGELRELEIEISVLSPLQKIASIEEIQLGRHGIYMRKGIRSGTLLPQVATETGWTKEEFLGHCAMDKAGIGWEGWKDAELFVYEALVFSERDLPAPR